MRFFKFLKTKYLLPLILAIFAIAIPYFTYARGLVPCGGQGEKPCNLCFLFLLLQNVMNFLVNTVGIVATLLLIIGGIMIVVSGVNKDWYERGKKIIFNTLVGTFIVLTAWILINTILTISGFARANIDLTGNWFELQCGTEPGTTTGLPDQDNETPPDGDEELPPTKEAEKPAGCTPCERVKNWTTEACKDAIKAASQSHGVQEALIKAIVWQENGRDNGAVDLLADRNEEDGTKSCGPMQVNTLIHSPCSDSKNPDGRGISYGTAELKKRITNSKPLESVYGVNWIELTAAAYNGGQGVNRESKDCGKGKPCANKPGGYSDREKVPMWLCPWDYTNGVCAPNGGDNPIGGYKVTRQYAPNVRAAYEKYKSEACLNQ